MIIALLLCILLVLVIGPEGFIGMLGYLFWIALFLGAGVIVLALVAG